MANLNFSGSTFTVAGFVSCAVQGRTGGRFRPPKTLRDNSPTSRSRDWLETPGPLHMRVRPFPMRVQGSVWAAL